MDAPSLSVFSFANQSDLRVIVQDGAPRFIAADVCQALGINNVTDALKRLDADEHALVSIEGISRSGLPVNVIDEAGLYSLILGSRKPQAKAFKRWVTHEVLPAIRKTGTYSIAPPQPEPIGPMMKLHVFVDPELHRAFKTKCILLGLTMRGEVNKLLEAYVGDFKASQALEYRHE